MRSRPAQNEIHRLFTQIRKMLDDGMNAPTDEENPDASSEDLRSDLRRLKKLFEDSASVVGNLGLKLGFLNQADA